MIGAEPSVGGSVGADLPPTAPSILPAAAARPLAERRRRMRELLDRVIGPSAQQFYIDGCRLVDGDVVLETGANVLAHCAREIESAVRGVLRVIFLEDVSTDPDHDCGFDEAEEGGSHRTEIERIVRLLGFDPTFGGRLAQAWIRIATGRGSGSSGKGLAARAHRRGLDRAAPLDDAVRTDWAEFEGVMTEVLRPLEAQFSRILPRLDGLALKLAPSGADLKRLQALPQTYATRRHFYDQVTPGWLPILDGAGVFERADDAFTIDVITQELVEQHWTAGEYLARVGALPEHHVRFVDIVSRMAIPHERAALDVIRTARTLPPDAAVPIVQRFAEWTRTRQRVSFIGPELGLLAAGVGKVPGGASAAAELFAALLAVRPDPRSRAEAT